MNIYKQKYLKYKKKYLNLIELIGGGKNKAENIYYSNIVNNFSEFKKILKDDLFLKLKTPLLKTPLLDTIESYIEENRKTLSKEELFEKFNILKTIYRIIETKIEQISDLKIIDESQREKIEKNRNNSNIYNIVITYYINGSLGSVSNIDKFVEYYEDFKLLKENKQNILFKTERVNLNDFNNLIELINFNQQNEQLLQKQLSGLVGGSYESIRKIYYNIIINPIKYNIFYNSLKIKDDFESRLPTLDELEKEKEKFNMETDRFVDTILPTLFDGIFDKLFNQIVDRTPVIFLEKAITLYLSGNLKTKDTPNSLRNLEIFIRNAELFKKIEDVNLNVINKTNYINIDYFGTFTELESYMMSKTDILRDIKNKRESVLKLERGKKEIEILLKNDRLQVVKPLSKEASQFWGLNTRWCTSAKINNMFYNYYQTGDIYIVISKIDNKKYQLSFEEEQFMDSEDKCILINELVEIINDREFTELLENLKKSYILVRDYRDNFTELDNIKSIKIGDMYIFRPSDKIHSNVETLNILSELTIPLEELLLQPSKLKRLKIKKLKVNIKPNTLPNSLLFLNLVVIDNVLILEKNVLPDNLILLELENYNYKFKVEDLPNNLKYLILKNSQIDFEPGVFHMNLESLKIIENRPDININYTNLPPNLKELYILFDHHYRENPPYILPNTLEKLSLKSYHHNIKNNVLPNNLKILKLYYIRTDKMIENDSLPLGLVELYLGGHNIELPELKKLKNLRILEINNRIELKDIHFLEGIEILQFSDNYDLDIHISHLPKSVKKIIMHDYYMNEIINDDRERKIEISYFNDN
jgi:hypothetical protein